MTDELPASHSGARPLVALAASQLIHACDCAALDFADTAELAPQQAPLGQERVLEAIEFATGIERSGYNLYVMGSPGVGKHHLLNQTLAAHAAARPAPSDWCYVADFGQPDRPNALQLPAGRGGELRHDMQQLVEDLLTALPAAFQSDEYRRRAQEIRDEFKAREDDIAATLGQHAAEQGIALLSTPTGYSLAPMHDDKVLSPQEFDALGDGEKARLQQAMGQIKEELRAVLGRIPLVRRELRQRFRVLDADVTGLTVGQFTVELENRYQDLPEVLTYLEAVRADVVEHGALFLPDDGSDGPAADDPRFVRYRVNLLVDNGAAGTVPVVYEDNPTYQNLLGRIEHVAHLGTLSTDFTLIRPGALHRANGGYLVLDVEEVLMHPFAWDALKRALNGEEIRIEPAERLLGLMGTVSLEPEPIPLRVKVALVGERRLYYLLKQHDDDFGALFKVVADFNEDMPRGPGRELAYAQLVATLQQREALRAVSRDGVGRIIDWAARRAGDGEKLSLHLGSLTELLYEADHFAVRGGSGIIDAGHVQQAVDARNRRTDQHRERLHEAILRNTLLIDTDGRQLGQVNGLVVIQAGDQAFGSPTRISATARIGGGEVVDIESEANLGGAIHGKGVMILSAYLANRYSRHQPLSVSASLVFEQSYGVIEGDSASLGELCALLSAIGDLSIDQSFAVTGSVNQHGQVQAVGGINEKIEGFFDICRVRGLSGRQGVVIPADNVADLMLRDDVRAAVGRGEFRVYAATHCDQVMALLTGMPAGVPDADGLYPADSANGRVQIRLIEWTAMRQQFSSGAVSPG
ncbi:MAG TPA: ATP-binding protein [Gammaproteobacteria bacterium]|nr:ATP-binding protein [Gammaproteobacteria bacterium]